MVEGRDTNIFTLKWCITANKHQLQCICFLQKSRDRLEGAPSSSAAQAVSHIGSVIQGLWEHTGEAGKLESYLALSHVTANAFSGKKKREKTLQFIVKRHSNKSFYFFFYKLEAEACQPGRVFLSSPTSAFASKTIR